MNSVAWLDQLCSLLFVDPVSYPGVRAQNIRLEQIAAVAKPGTLGNYNERIKLNNTDVSLKYPSVYFGPKYAYNDRR